MPLCFQLFPKGSNEPIILQHMDDEMCRHFGVEPNPDRWLGYWFDVIGFKIASGKSFEEIRAYLDEKIVENKAKGNPNQGVEFYENLVCILEYIQERFTTNSYYTRIKE